MVNERFQVSGVKLEEYRLRVRGQRSEDGRQRLSIADFGFLCTSVKISGEKIE